MKKRGFLNLRIAHHRILLWIVAFLITAASAVYQRRTGPTYPVRGKVVLDEMIVSYRLLRSHDVGQGAPIHIAVPDTSVTGYVRYKWFEVPGEEWKTIPLIREDDALTGRLPERPPAGKIMYFVYLEKDGEEHSLSADEPVVIRYKGSVPAAVLIPHVILMFLAMILSTRAGLEALDAGGKFRRYMLWTIVLFFISGFILGPIIQKYAFGAYWTGIPFGTDLTDNKTLIAMLGWVVAWIQTRRGKDGRGWVVFAAVLMLVVYLVPHSLLGSELKYTPPSGQP